MKVGWLSRHPPLPAQINELRRLFGHVELAWDARTFGAVTELRERVLRYDEVVIVAPLSMLAKLTETGIHPLWAHMEPCTEVYAGAHPESAVAAPRGRSLRFARFKRLTGVNFEFEEVEGVQTV
jgi:hypothetical protein